MQLRVVAFENVETHGLFTKRWIYQQYAVPVRSWDALEQCADKVSLRVDHGHSASRFDVIEREVEEKSALTDSGRPQNVDVMPSVGGGNSGRRVSPVLEQADDVPVATRPTRGRESCRRSPKTANVNWQMEEAGEFVGYKNRVAGRSASFRKPLIEATSEPDPRRTQAVGSIKSSKCGDYPVHLRRRFLVAACRGPKTDLCAITGKRRFACRRQWSGGPRSWRRPRRLLGQHEVEEPVPQPSQNGDDQAAFRRHSGKQIQLALRPLLPVDVGAQGKLHQARRRLR